MGHIIDIKGCKETILEREKDLGVLIHKYMGSEAMDLYQDILKDRDDMITNMEKEYEENESDAAIFEDIIDKGRANIDYLIADIENDDCPDRDQLLRTLRNIYWDMGH